MNGYQLQAGRRFAAAAAIGLAALWCSGSSVQAQSQEWSFDREKGGGFAEICNKNERRPQKVCAVVYCGRGVDGLQVGLRGWEPRGQGDKRSGPIRVDGKGRDVDYIRDRNRIVGDVWRVDMGRGKPRLIDRMKKGADMSVDISRAPPFRFALDGSYDAINQLEQRCNRIEDRIERRRDQRAGNNNDDAAIRFGSDELGVEIAIGGKDGVSVRATGDEPKGDRRGDRRANADRDFGPRWEKIARNRVDSRRPDTDVIDLGRSDGRFDAIRLVALRKDIRVRKMKVKYGNGVEHEVDVERWLKAGDTSNLIRLRGRKGRFIDRITLTYQAEERNRRGIVEVWGRSTKGRG